MIVGDFSIGCVVETPPNRTGTGFDFNHVVIIRNTKFFPTQVEVAGRSETPSVTYAANAPQWAATIAVPFAGTERASCAATSSQRDIVLLSWISAARGSMKGWRKNLYIQGGRRLRTPVHL